MSDLMMLVNKPWCGAGSRTSLVMVDGNPTGESYHAIIVQQHAVPFFNAHLHHHILQPINAKPHVVTAFLQRNNVHFLPWSAVPQVTSSTKCTANVGAAGCYIGENMEYHSSPL